MQLYVEGTDNLVQIGTGVALGNLLIAIRGTGNRLVIEDDCGIQGHIELLGSGNRVHIGRRTGIMYGRILAHGGREVRIGRGCMFSGEVEIRTSDNHPIRDGDGVRINPDKDVRIGDRVWLGARVCVLKGARIGPDTVIGMGAVVSGEIPSNSVAVGVPARVVRGGTNWSVT